MNSSAGYRFALKAAGLFGATGVALGALGAHRLEATLAERGMTHAWDTGSRYHLLHALALLALAALWRATADPIVARRLRAVTWSWAVGIILFSGSLYWFALGGPHPLVYATPLGGIALLAGWVLVIAAAFSRSGDNPTGDQRE